MTQTLLSGLWTFSLVLAAASTIAMLIVIGRRAVLSVDSFTVNELRDAVLQALMTDWSLIDTEVSHRFLKRRRHLASLLVEFSTLVRGPEFERGIDVLAEAGAINQLTELLNHGNQEDRLVACAALSQFKSEPAARQLTRVATRASSMKLRIAAVHALLEMGSRLSLEQVIKWMRLGNSEVPAEATAVLLVAARQSPEEAMRRISGGQDNVAIRAALVWAVSESGMYDAIGLFEQLMVHNDARIRVAAVHAISELGFITDKTMLHYCLADGVAEVRAEAASAIGKMADASAVAHLSVLLGDPDWDVRFRAANALVDVGPPGIAELEANVSRGHAGSRSARAAAMVLSERHLK